MKCVNCKLGKLKTTKTEDTIYATIRYKKCTYCGTNYKTIEKFIKGDDYYERSEIKKVSDNR